jgi:hypothetical protein
LVPATAWQKKEFRKYFAKVENFEQFRCIVHLLLQAPTLEITKLLQEEIVLWLKDIGEARASSW